MVLLDFCLCVLAQQTVQDEARKVWVSLDLLVRKFLALSEMRWMSEVFYPHTSTKPRIRLVSLYVLDVLPGSIFWG